MLEDFESISPTAILTSYPRTFTDIPYEKEIYEWLNKNCNTNVKLNRMLAPEIEARYKLINKLLDKSDIKQVLELAAGYSSRGLIYSQKGYNYVELDLLSVSNNKKKLLNDLCKTNNSLNLVSGNALNYDDFLECKKYLDKNRKIVIINEGLMRYLTFEEKRIVATNIYKMLKEYGGVWITCDVTPKKYLQKQYEANPTLNGNIDKVTSRNSLNDRFEDEKHIRSFFNEIGFKEIEIHKFIEEKENLKSFELIGIDSNECDELLENGVVAILKV